MLVYVYHVKHRSVSFTTQAWLLFEKDEVTAGFKTVSSWLCLLNQSCYGYYKSSHDGIWQNTCTSHTWVHEEYISK